MMLERPAGARHQLAALRSSTDFAYPVFAALSFILALGVALPVGWLAIWCELRPWRKAAGAHWTEQARRIHPVRGIVTINAIFLAGAAAMVALRLNRAASFGWAPAGALIGAWLAGFSLSRQIFPTLKFTAWLRTVGIVLLFMVLNWGSLAAATFLMPVTLSWQTWALPATYLAIFLALQFGLGVRLLRALGVLRPASERIQQIVAATSAQAGVRPRAVWEMVTPAANAYAYLTIRQIAFTTGLVDIATDAELKAVCAHELAHLTESRTVIAARIAGGALLFPLVFIRPMTAAWPTAGVPVLLLVICVAFYGLRRMSRRLEVRADRAALGSAVDPQDYARALEKIHQVNRLPAVLRGQSLHTHPNLYDRLVAANVPVAYPRPPKPRRFAWTSMVLMMAFIVMVAVMIGTASPRRHRRPATYPREQTE